MLVFESSCVSRRRSRERGKVIKIFRFLVLPFVVEKDSRIFCVDSEQEFGAEYNCKFLPRLLRLGVALTRFSPSVYLLGELDTDLNMNPSMLQTKE
jgi:hypothetical protein